MREERLANIELYIREHKSVSLDTLCNAFSVSKNTIRRDVNELVERTDIRKIYGGVSCVRYNLIPPPFAERAVLNIEAKKQIGRCAAKLVEDDDVIYIDSGTTTCHMVDYLYNCRNVTVVTHSLEVINRVMLNPALELISLSGRLNRKTLSFTGHSTIDTLKNLNISKAFMAANGVTAQNGATQSTSIEFAIKKSVVGQSNFVCLMVENRKFGEVSLLTYCPLESIGIIITEKPPKHEFLENYRALGGRIITPD